jgi:hypothetical protein
MAGSAGYAVAFILAGGRVIICNMTTQAFHRVTGLGPSLLKHRIGNSLAMAASLRMVDYALMTILTIFTNRPLLTSIAESGTSFAAEGGDRQGHEGATEANGES